jgi:biopolymer transport protein ExbB
VRQKQGETKPCIGASSGSRKPEACATTCRGRIKGAMPTLPDMLSKGGPVLWLLLLISAVGVAVFIERFLHCHRAQINSTEFLNGVRTVLKRNNVIEAISICDATPGPVARLVKTAILNRDHGRERVREALEEAGLAEVPRLEEKLDLLATIAQLAPLLGLLGTMLGFIQTFYKMQEKGLTAHFGLLSDGVWRALVCAAAGLAVAIPAHAGYNYLVNRINAIVLDMERSATEIVQIVTEGIKPPPQS